MNIPQPGPISVRAPLRPYGLFGRFYYSPDADDKGDDKPDDQPDEPLTMSRRELQKLIDDNRKEAEKASEAKAAQRATKDQEERDRKAAEEQGKYKELADKERSEKEKLAAENRSLRVGSALRDHLAEKHPEYAGCAKYILPQVPADADDTDKAIATATADYVKDNPRTATNPGGAPPAAPGNKLHGTSRFAAGRPAGAPVDHARTAAEVMVRGRSRRD